MRQPVQLAAVARYAEVVSRSWASGSLWCVSQPSWVTSTSGANALTAAGTTARNASSHASSLVRTGAAR